MSGLPLSPVVAGLRRRFGTRLRQLREEAALSQERLAEAAGLDRKTISRVETGVHSPHLDHVFLLAVALDTEVGELFAWDCEPGGTGDA